jgi:trehalose 6-phosphate synthase
MEWAPDIDPVLREASRAAGYVLRPVHLETADAELFYNGFANGIIWPLFHDLPSHCAFIPEAWQAYQRANKRFAETVAECCGEADHIWVHDYHLMRVAEEVRALGVATRLGLFLHVPFPPLDMFVRLPWRAEVLNSLLAYDLVGFQTLRDRRNFLYCVNRLLPEWRVRGKGTVVTAESQGREVRVGSFPISIDYAEFEGGARTPEVEAAAATIREQLGDRTIILGVDRLDYTKGIPEKLEAFRRALRRHPELRGAATLVQIAVPSRQAVPEYQELRARIDQLVGEINGEFTMDGWAPIHYLFRSLDRDALLAHYRAADVCLLTPLKDGMNLVAKEYCASRTDGQGTLILSEFAGAASQLHRWALTVNPHDVEGVADAIYRACSMPPGEQRNRMRHLRRTVRTNDIYRWVDEFLEAAVSKSLTDFPFQEDYMPPMESHSPPDHAPRPI